MTSSIASDVVTEAGGAAASSSTSTAGRPSAPARRATVTIERELCKGCGFCIEFCPAHALESDPGFNAKGYHPPRLSHPEACVGCNLCGLYCPDFAIYGHALPREGAARPAPAPKDQQQDQAQESHR